MLSFRSEGSAVYAFHQNTQLECTANLPAEPNKSFISNKNRPTPEPNEPKEPKPPPTAHPARSGRFRTMGVGLRQATLVLLNKGNLKLKESSKAIVENLLHLGLTRDGSGKYGDAPPLRSELFSAEQMKQHGRALAGQHKLSTRRASDQLLARLAANESVLVAVHTLLTEALAAERQITPAGEWLLDNYYLIEEQIRTAKRHLPKAYSRELPRLLHGPSAGLPRVYDIALEIISHGDGRVDPESLTSFVDAYQSETPLNLGELWALPIMLRLALIENLRRVSARIAGDRISRNRADTWADQLTETATKDPKNLIVVIADMARSNPPMDSAFVAELTRRLQGQGSALVLPLTWIEQRLAETGWTIQQMVQSENQKQAADQVSMSNSIGSLRFLSALDWRKFVETMSVVEQTLRQDAGGIYGRMEFATRDQYRHVVERIAKYSGRMERDVARKAIELTHHGTAAEGERRETHVGFYLIGEGVDKLERAVETRFPIAERARESLSQIARAAVRRRHRCNHADAGRASCGQGVRQPGGYLGARRDRRIVVGCGEPVRRCPW